MEVGVLACIQFFLSVTTLVIGISNTSKTPPGEAKHKCNLIPGIKSDNSNQIQTRPQKVVFESVEGNSVYNVAVISRYHYNAVATTTTLLVRDASTSRHYNDLH